MIEVAGLKVPVSALSELALRLSNDGDYALAVHLGRLIDSGTGEFPMRPRQEGELLLAIDRYPIIGLEPLRAHLIARCRERSAV